MARPTLAGPWLAAVVVGVLALVFEIDRATGAAPFQHLYYLPIILAAAPGGTRAGLSVSIAAVVLYHLANPALRTAAYKESDLVQIALFIAVGVVTSRLADNARRLHQIATTDDLTGLHNLRSFEARLRAMIRACREAGEPVAMFVLDLDRLKNLNDTHGHLAGAEAVRTVGHVLSAHLPPQAVACRYGGDEFVVAIPSHTDVRARSTAEELRLAVQRLTPVLAGQSFPTGTLSISLGVACLHFVPAASSTSLAETDVQIGEALFRAADRGLYTAKEQGRDRVSVAQTSASIANRPRPFRLTRVGGTRDQARR